MKTKSLKKVLTTLAVVVAMLLLAGLTLVGCGNKTVTTPDLPAINQVTFSDYFELKSYQEYTGNATNSTNLSDVETKKVYKTVTFTVKKGIILTDFAFKMTAANNTNQSISVALTAGDRTYISDDINFNNTKEQTYRFHYAVNNSTEARWTLAENSTLTLTIGIKSKDNVTNNWIAYNEALGLSNFVAGV